MAIGKRDIGESKICLVEGDNFIVHHDLHVHGGDSQASSEDDLVTTGDGGGGKLHYPCNLNRNGCRM